MKILMISWKWGRNTERSKSSKTPWSWRSLTRSMSKYQLNQRRIRSLRTTKENKKKHRNSFSGNNFCNKNSSRRDWPNERGYHPWIDLYLHQCRWVFKVELLYRIIIQIRTQGMGLLGWKKLKLISHLMMSNFKIHKRRRKQKNN